MPKKKDKKDKKKSKAEEVIIGVNTKKRTKTNQKKAKKKNEAYHRIVLAMIKWIILIVLLVGAILFFLSTPIFNISQISITGNSKVSTDTIEELSQMKLGDNIYRLSKNQIQKNIKENPYIENIEIKRKLPSELQIIVKERQATYLLEMGGGFMSMNNQGYLLEKETEANGLPILVGVSTKMENWIEGQRLEEEDLIRLETVLKIMDSINVKGITEKVSKIDMTNKQNYTLLFEEEGKTVYLGDASDISTRILRLKAILGQTKGETGEIFINGDTRKQ